MTMTSAMMELDEFKENLPSGLYCTLANALKVGYEQEQAMKALRRVPVVPLELTDDLRWYTMHYLYADVEIGSVDPGYSVDVKLHETVATFAASNRYMEQSRIFELLRTPHQLSTRIDPKIWDKLRSHVKTYAKLAQYHLVDIDVPDHSDNLLVQTCIRILSIVEVSL